MGSFSGDIKRFVLHMRTRHDRVFVKAAETAHVSIVRGSPITGAPGQPVDTGDLAGSWQLVFESNESAIIGTNVAYAQPVEDGVGRYGQPVTYGKGGAGKSKRGGSHSVDMTRAGWNRIVEHALEATP